MLFPSRLALTLGVILGMSVGAATFAQAAPAAGLVQAAPALATTSEPLAVTPPIEKAYWHRHWHHWHGRHHYWHRHWRYHHWHRWHRRW